MVGLESNTESVRYARENITQNKLNQRITIIEQNSNSNRIFGSLFEDQPNSSFDFCMCNPPFFGSLEELQPPTHQLGKRNRTGKRRAAKCPPSGSTDELFVDGGEIEFVRKIVEESCELKTKIKVYTTMLGHKSNVANVFQLLGDRNILNISTTEFCQGHTTRWGIAWSFVDTILLQSVPQYGPSFVKSVTENKSYSFVTMSENTINLDDIRIQLVNILKSIDIKLANSNVLSKNQWKGQVVTHNNSWSNQRRKRRKLERNSEVVEADLEDSIINDQSDNPSFVEPFLIANLTIVLKQTHSAEPNQFGSIIDVEYVSGTGKRDAANQLMQFIKNRWK